MSRLKPHFLSIFFAAIFLLALGGQSWAGMTAFNEEQLAHGAAGVTWAEFVASSDFVVDVAENWQSEFLQFFVFTIATIWFVQVGSGESKKPGNEGVGTDKEQLLGRYPTAASPKWARAGGWRTTLYSNSLLLTMGLVFLLSWWIQSVGGQVVYNHEQSEHGQPELDWLGYVASADFWNRTLQNWQSEFLAVGCMVAFSIYLRQRGSSESKPVGTPHNEAAIEGE